MAKCERKPIEPEYEYQAVFTKDEVDYLFTLVGLHVNGAGKLRGINQAIYRALDGVGANVDRFKSGMHKMVTLENIDGNV